MRRTTATAILAALSLTSAQALPGLPGLPSLPGMPQLPGLPALPTLPSLPALPSLPSFPNLPTVRDLTGAVPTPPALTTAPANDRGTAKPDYSRVTTLFNFPDTRLETLPKGKVPYLGVNNVQDLRTSQQNAAECRQARIERKPAVPARCPQYEWQVPYSSEGDSQAVARGLRQDWQRLEDRYYWRAMLELNNPGMLATHCLIDLGTGLKTNTPPVKVNVPPGSVPTGLQGKIGTAGPQPKMNLDAYLPLPQVPNGDYCAEIGPDLTIMFLPGTCTYLGSWKLFCIEGTTETLNPLAPRPLMFNTAAAQARVRSAISKAHTTYLTEYQQDVLETLFNPKEHKFFFPLPWHSNIPGDGAIIAPVMNTSVALTQFNTLAQTARAKLGGVIGANAYPYYFQWAYSSPTLAVHTLPGRNEALGTPPGLWQLEEFKRSLGPSSLALQERFGYATFFQAWNEMRALTLPEPAAAKAARPVTYIAFGNNVYLGLPSTVVPVPAPVPIHPYFGVGLPFTGPQMQFDWVSVPEGYSIPRVSGRPVFDYASLLR